MSNHEHISTRYETVDDVGSVALATVLTSELRDELEIRQLGAELLSLLSSDPAAVIVNMGKVEFLASSGVSQFIRLWKKSEADDIRLVLAETQDTPMEVFQLTGLDQKMEFNTTEQRALRSLAFPGE